MPDLTPAQRVIAETLNSHEWADSEYPGINEASAHRLHRYDYRCGICRSDVAEIARIAEPVIRRAVTVAALRAEADRTETYTQDGGTGRRIQRRRYVHDERARTELHLRADEIEAAGAATTDDGETT